MVASRHWAALALLTVSLGVGCSSSEDGSNVGGKGSGSGSGGSGGGGDDLVFAGDDGTVTFGEQSSDFEACAAETVATEAVPLDIYIMFDRSCSMSCDPELVGPGLCCPGDPNARINQVRDAVGAFLNSPDSAGIGVGIGYFGYLPTGNTSCDPAQYANAEVPIATLPDNIAPIVDSLNRAEPVGETPTGAAIRGACQYAGGWQAQNPAHRTVILLVTDGVPEAPVSGFCNPTVEDAAQAAADCLNGSGIATYVLGVSGRLDNLNLLAESGGTESAYLVGASADVTAGVLQALTQIRDAAVVPCEFQVPPAPEGEQIDPNLVNVTFERASGDVELIAAAGSAEGCNPGGWYFEEPGVASVVKLCPATCDEVTTNLIAASVRGKSARIDLQYGCDTVVVTR